MLYYYKGEYGDGTLAITTWTDEDGYLEEYGDVSVNLGAYGMYPEEGTIFIPTYKVCGKYLDTIMNDIVDEVIREIPIGYGKGIQVRLKPDWEQNVHMVEGVW